MTDTSHWPMTVQAPTEKDGMVVLEEHTNIEDGKFVLPQVYAFPINDKDGEDGSITVHRCCIPVGTAVEEGYKAVRNFIKHIVDADDKEVENICFKLNFPEVVGVPF